MNNRLIKYKYPGAKRLMLEAHELRDNTEDYCAQPIDDNLFEWHFTVRGPPDTAFDGGFYHGRLSFPTEYPMKPPSIILLTPNGRFETNKKICLSISGYHPETWQPSWSVRTALLALIAFMPTKANRAIGSLDFSDVERRKLALKSRSWKCETCGLIKELLVQPNSPREESSVEGPSCSSDSRIEEDVESDRQSQTNSQGSLSDASPLSSEGFKELKSTESSGRPSSNAHSLSKNVLDDKTKKSTRVEEFHVVPPLNSTMVNHLHDQIEANSQQIVIDRRRAYPSLVLKSIFVLISLLIIRRVVILMQS